MSGGSLSMRNIQNTANPDPTAQFIGVIYALVVTAVIVILASGCSPTLTAQSAAPPGRSARMDEVSGFWGPKSYRVELSAGVALAVSCYEEGPCEKLVMTSEDPAIAEVHAASLGTLERAGFANQQTTAAVVVVGKTPGTTKLHMSTKRGGKRVVAVTVIAPPVPTPPAAVAR